MEAMDANEGRQMEETIARLVENGALPEEVAETILRVFWQTATANSARITAIANSLTRLARIPGAVGQAAAVQAAVQDVALPAVDEVAVPIAAQAAVPAALPARAQHEGNETKQGGRAC
jgi:hypothetical protein